MEGEKPGLAKSCADQKRPLRATKKKLPSQAQAPTRNAKIKTGEGGKGCRNLDLGNAFVILFSCERL